MFAGNLLAADGDRRTFDFGEYGSISATETIHTPGVWEGRIDGKNADAGGWLMQIETNVGRVLVAHGADGRVLQSLPLGNGTFNVFEQEAASFPDCGGAIEAPTVVPNEGGVAGNCDDGETLDVLVKWTPTASSQAGGEVAIRALAEASVAISNHIYIACNVNLRMRAVGYGVTEAYTGDAGSTVLSELRSTSDGILDAVHAERTATGADLVSLLTGTNPNYCGIAYLEGTATSEASGFNVTVWSCALGNLSFTHEVGHNQGCCHANGDGGGCTSGGVFPYSVGHRFTTAGGTQFRTTMAYAPGTRIPRFSSPLVNFAGMPTGTPEADNARTLNETAIAMANYRCSVPQLDEQDHVVSPIMTFPLTGQTSAFTAPAVPRAADGTMVDIDTSAVGDLGAADESLTLRVGATSIGAVIGFAGVDCAPFSRRTSIPAATFNAAIGNGTNVLFTLVPSTTMDTPCTYSEARVVIRYVCCSRSSLAGWGLNNDGQCDTPLGLGIVTDIAAGKSHTVAIKADGTVAAWGSNNDSQSTVPAGLGVVTRIAAGDYHTVALKVNGSLAAWGNNSNGQCNIPAGLGVVTRIAAGAYHTVALKADGAIAAWGNNGSGQCTVPPGLGVVGQIAAGDSHTVALKADGAVAAWGSNNYGQCTIPPGLGVVTQIAAGAFHTVAVKANGSVAAWGLNNYGQCTVPQGLGVVTHIDAGIYHTVVAKATGFVAAWGDNGSGQCNVPVELGFVTRVAAGGYHTVVMWPELADDCATATTAVLGINSINTSLLSPSANPPENGACPLLQWFNSKDAWFVYDAPSSGLLSADFCASSYDTSVVLYQGSCGALVRVGCDADSCGSSYRSRIIDLPVQSGPVYIRIGGYQTAAGIATFNLSFEGSADDCVNAATAVLGMNSIDTSLLTPSANPPENGACVELDWGNSKDAWFVYNAPSSGLLSADFCASSYDTSVVIYQGSCGALVRVGCADDECGYQNTRSRIIDLPVQSGPVYIRIGGWEAVAGLATFDLSFARNCITDLDGNGSTGGSDLGILLGAWGSSGADLNADGLTNGADLGILLSGWGVCN
jgi:hypothetical protein